jgi:mono/diheme cytochrome c family protein
MTMQSRPMAAAVVVAVLTIPSAAGATSAADVAAASGAAADGKQIFLDQKCNMCHAVSSASITPTGKIKAPDLAGLASKADAAFLKKYLKKEADKKGKKHLKPFTGTDAQLEAVVSWLQKQDEK